MYSSSSCHTVLFITLFPNPLLSGAAFPSRCHPLCGPASSTGVPGPWHEERSGMEAEGVCCTWCGPLWEGCYCWGTHIASFSCRHSFSWWWCLVAQCVLLFRKPMDCIAPRLLCSWDFPGKNTGVGCHFLLQGIFPDPGIEPVSSALTGRFFIAEPPGKPLPVLVGILCCKEELSPVAFLFKTSIISMWTGIFLNREFIKIHFHHSF